MSDQQEKLQQQVYGFRISELQQLMVFAGRSKAGRKIDLRSRALELVKLNSSDISLKIKELSDAMYSSGEDREASTSSGSGSYSNPYTEPVVSPPVSHKLVYPTFPDVTLRRLPFFKLCDTLLKPSSLQPSGNQRFQDQNFSFYLTPGQAGDISGSSYRSETGRPEYRTQIQMRFSLLETSCDQEDNFPSSICVKVNSKLCPLPNPVPTSKPGAEPRRPPRPINITALAKLSATSANIINVSWAVEVGRAHTISVYQVEELTYMDLLAQLKAKGQRQPDYTKALIKEKLADADQEIATTSCKVTLACPLGKMRMNAPCRATSCDHLQCFDAQLYLQMNERKPKWVCPVCNKPALLENLLIDGFFSDIIKSARLPGDEHEIVLHNDGSWDPLPAKPVEECCPGPDLVPDPGSTVVVDTDQESDLECITLDSDSEAEGEDACSPVSPVCLPPKKRARLEGPTGPAQLLQSPDSPELICLDDD